MWVTKVLKSIRYALEGLKYTVVTQRNMRIHFFTALTVLLLSLYFPVSKLEVLILFVAMILVLFAELINTAIEAVVDMVTEEYHPLAKIAKDVAAGAVLLTAGLAVIVGISVFYPYLNVLFLGLSTESFYTPHIGIALVVAFDFFLTILLKGWFHRMDWKAWEPSMSTSVTVCITVLIVSMIAKLIVALLMLLLLLIFLGTRLRMQINRKPVLMGLLLGASCAFLGVQWL